jgi:hypothetical protein
LGQPYVLSFSWRLYIANLSSKLAAVGHLFLGSDAGAASIVAATFMAGLGFGSLYGAMFSKNLSQRKCITAGAGMLYSKE